MCMCSRLSFWECVYPYLCDKYWIYICTFVCEVVFPILQESLLTPRRHTSYTAKTYNFNWRQTDDNNISLILLWFSFKRWIQHLILLVIYSWRWARHNHVLATEAPKTNVISTSAIVHFKVFISFPLKSHVNRPLCRPQGAFAAVKRTLSATCKQTRLHFRWKPQVHTINNPCDLSNGSYFGGDSACLTWLLQEIRGLCPIHHMLSLSKCAKWFY